MIMSLTLSWHNQEKVPDQCVTVCNFFNIWGNDSPHFTHDHIKFFFSLQAFGEGDHFPIWGTCLGFQLITALASEKYLLTDFDAEDLALPLNFSDSKIILVLVLKQTRLGSNEISKNWSCAAKCVWCCFFSQKVLFVYLIFDK